MDQQKAPSTATGTTTAPAPAPADTAMAGSEEMPGSANIRLGPDIEIFPDRPRPDLASYGTLAFEAQDRRQAHKQIAILSSRRLVPRITSLATYKSINSPHILRLTEAGVVLLPETKKQ